MAIASTAGMSTFSFRSALPLVLLSCTSTAPGARPHDLSAERHTSVAREHDGVAAEHAAQYYPEADEVYERCRLIALSREGLGDDFCWTSTVNRTEEHRREAAKHRRIAAEHRAASEALRKAEESACTGISPDDRDISPFLHREDITGVEPYSAGSPEAAGGASVTFRAVPGMTAKSLQRLVACHLARNSALGHVANEMPDCPLVPKNAQATVLAVPHGFVVRVRSDDPAAAREILARARRLLVERDGQRP